MVKVNGIAYDGWLAKNLDVLKKNVMKDWDFWLLIDGREGSGKSTLAQQVAVYLDPDFNLDRVVFTPQQFSDACETAPRYGAIVWDEAITGLQSTDLTAMARTLKAKAVQMRQKNLFIILVIHSFFDMNKYYTVHRTFFLLHVYFKAEEERELFKRGYFEFYDFQKKKTMYLTDKYRRYYYYGLKPNFRGTFSSKLPVDKQAYIEKKATDPAAPLRDDKEFILECIRRGMPVAEFKAYVSFKERTVYKYKEMFDLENKRSQSGVVV